MSESRREGDRIAKFSKLGRLLQELIKQEADPMFGLNEAFIGAFNEEIQWRGFELHRIEPK